jgi:hypothetical protein
MIRWKIQFLFFRGIWVQLRNVDGNRRKAQIRKTNIREELKTFNIISKIVTKITVEAWHWSVHIGECRGDTAVGLPYMPFDAQPFIHYRIFLL